MDNRSSKTLFSRIKEWFFPPPPVHDIWLDGVCGFVFSTKEGGRFITVSGWSNNHWQYEEGHIARFLKKEGDGSARPSTYRILSVSHCGDPHDMFFLDCEYIGSAR